MPKLRNHKLTTLVLLAVPLIAQTKIDLANQSKNADFSAFAVVKPNPVGTVLPATCGIGALFFLQTSPGVGTLYSCTATNVWGAISGYSLPQATTTTLGGVIVPTGTGITVSSGNLGLTYGTAANTITQGNDSRVTGAAQKSANLSDLANATTARTNLGLGSFALLNTLACAGLSNDAPSCSTDTTNAANITSGTLPNARIIALPNANLANSSITVTAGTGLQTGGLVSLGGTVTLAALFGTTSGTIAQGNDSRFTAIGNATSIQSNAVLAGAPTAGQTYLWSAGNNRFELGTPGGTGSSTGGSDKSVQYNDGGVFNGVINASATKAYLYQTNSAVPAFQLTPIPAADLDLIPLTTGVSGTLPVANGGTGAVALTANRLLLGSGTSAVAVVGSLGTTTTLLHGNAAGAPTFGAVSLTADVSGSLPIANGGTGQTTANAGFNALSPMTTLGDVIYGGASGVATRRAGNTTTTPKYLTSTGAAGLATAPTFGDITSIQGNAILAGTPSNGQAYIWNTSNSRFELGAAGGGGGGSFTGISSGTNITMAALCGTGCTMGTTGSGTIAATSSTTATQLNGTGPFSMVGAVGTPPGSVAVGQVGCWYDNAANTFRCKDSSGTASAMVTNTTPASSTASCTVPQAAYDTNFYYVCVSLNVWKRVSVVTF